MFSTGEAARMARLLRELRVVAELETQPDTADWVPERWKQDPTWRCANRHVSKTFVAAWWGQPYCKFECGSRVLPTFPGDRSGPLSSPRRAGRERPPSPDVAFPTQVGPLQAPDARTPKPARHNRMTPRGHRLT